MKPPYSSSLPVLNSLLKTESPLEKLVIVVQTLTFPWFKQPPRLINPFHHYTEDGLGNGYKNVTEGAGVGFDLHFVVFSPFIR